MSARERHRAGELPWGWWLRARGDMLEDEDGRTWRTVREAFWQGELGFSSVHFANEQHELMLRVLSAIDSRWLGALEGRHELFDGDMLFWRFYQCWLSSIGLIGPEEPAVWESTPLDAGLTPDGRSVLMMLRATHEPAWEALLMKDVVDVVVAAGRGTDLDAREAALRTFEDGVGFRRHAGVSVFWIGSRLAKTGRTKHILWQTGQCCPCRLRKPSPERVAPTFPSRSRVSLPQPIQLTWAVSQSLGVRSDRRYAAQTPVAHFTRPLSCKIARRFV